LFQLFLQIFSWQPRGRTKSLKQSCKYFHDSQGEEQSHLNSPPNISYYSCEIWNWHISATELCDSVLGLSELCDSFCKYFHDSQADLPVLMFIICWSVVQHYLCRFAAWNWFLICKKCHRSSKRLEISSPCSSIS